MPPSPHEPSPSRHVLQIHHGDEGRLAALVLGARAALAAGELVVLVSDRPEQDEAVLRRALDENGDPPPGARLRTCTPDQLRSPAEVRRFVAAAADEGYAGVRLLRPAPVPSEAVADYRDRERTLDQLGHELPLTTVCCYDARAATPDGLHAAVTAHRRVVETCLTLVTEPGTGGEVAISLAGDVDLSNVALLGWAVRAALTSPPGADERPEADVDRLVVDASGLQVLSAAGFRALVESTAPLREAGGEVRLVETSPVVRRVVEILAAPPVTGLVVEGRRS